MVRRASEAGEGALKALFWLAILAAAVVFCVKYVPVKIATAEFYDFMNEQAKFAQGASEESLKKRIVDKGVELNLPLTKDSCTVTKPGDNIRMSCEYEIEVDFIILKHTYRYHPQINQPLFIF